MSEVTLPTFPVDEITLNAIKHTFGGSFTVDDDGKYHLEGADYTLNQLLDHYSGYDQSKSEFTGASPGVFGEDVDWYTYPDAVYTVNDVIAALITEVERLRG